MQFDEISHPEARPVPTQCLSGELDLSGLGIDIGKDKYLTLLR